MYSNYISMIQIYKINKKIILIIYYFFYEDTSKCDNHNPFL